jgi:hypothetical protein
VNTESHEEGAPVPTLVYLYGPPAAGKLTIAQPLAQLTGFRLFHNHLSVNAVSSIFPIGTEPYVAVLHRLRLDVLETAARAGISMIFTNNSAWGPNARGRFAAFAGEADRVVKRGGGRTVFVKISAPTAELEKRLASESRRAHRKLLDVHRLRQLLADLDPSPLHPDDLLVDTGSVSPDEAAHLIARHVLQRMISPRP